MHSHDCAQSLLCRMALTGRAMRLSGRPPSLLLASGNPSAQAPSTRHAELAATRDAWRAAVALCQRHGRDAGPQAAEGLWFEVLQVSPQAAEGAVI